jgi:hypothetical protein
MSGLYHAVIDNVGKTDSYVIKNGLSGCRLTQFSELKETQIASNSIEQNSLHNISNQLKGKLVFTSSGTQVGRLESLASPGTRTASPLLMINAFAFTFFFITRNHPLQKRMVAENVTKPTIDVIVSSVAIVVVAYSKRNFVATAAISPRRIAAAKDFILPARPSFPLHTTIFAS